MIKDLDVLNCPLTKLSHKIKTNVNLMEHYKIANVRELRQRYSFKVKPGFICKFACDEAEISRHQLDIT